LTMKRMAEIRDMSNEELMERLRELRRELFIVRSRGGTVSASGGEKTHVRRELRREIARILTVLRERGAL